MIMIFGILLSKQARFCQIRQFPAAIRISLIYSLRKRIQKESIDQSLFACVGGCIGIGNVVGVCTAVQIGGPGRLLGMGSRNCWDGFEIF